MKILFNIIMKILFIIINLFIVMFTFQLTKIGVRLTEEYDIGILIWILIFIGTFFIPILWACIYNNIYTKITKKNKMPKLEFRILFVSILITGLTFIFGTCVYSGGDFTSQLSEVIYTYNKKLWDYNDDITNIARGNYVKTEIDYNAIEKEIYNNPFKDTSSNNIKRINSIRKNHTKVTTLNFSSINRKKKWLIMSTHIKVRGYLKLGANPNIIPKVLGQAIESEDVELVKILIDNGADINLKNGQGELPIHLAVQCSYEITKLLIDKGANVNAKNDRRQTPLDLVEDFYTDRYSLERMIKFINNPDEVMEENKRIAQTPNYIYPKEKEKNKIIQLLIDNGANHGIKDDGHDFYFDSKPEK